MWARAAEFMLACWLAVSPFVFAHEERGLWAADLACAAALAALALLSFCPRLRRAHLAELAVAGWMTGSAWLQDDPKAPRPALQNRMGVGLVLLMLPIVPTRADRPPEAWERRHGPDLPPGDQHPL